MQNSETTFEDSFTVYYVGKHMLNMQLSNFTPIYPREVRTYVHTKTYIHHNFIHDSPQSRKKCPSTTEQIAILWPIHTMKYYSSIKGDNLIDAKMWMNFKNLLRERSL